MKKYLLSFFVFCLCSIVNAQIPVITEFDFSDPTSLTPSITPAPDGKGIQVNDKTFTSGDISITFTTTGVTPGTTIETFVDDYTGIEKHYLYVGHHVRIEIKCANGGTLDKIEFVDNSELAGLAIVEPASSKIDYYACTWTSGEEKSSTLILENNSVQYATIYRMKVYYTLPKNILEPTVDIDPANDINTFSELNLTFEKKLKTTANTAGITAKFNEESKSIKSVAIKDNVVTITLAETIATDGTLVINIPAGTFENVDGFCNKDLTYTYNIIRKRDVLNPTVCPESGTSLHSISSNQIYLLFNKQVPAVADTLFRVKKEGSADLVCRAKPILKADTVFLEFIEITPAIITEQGNYSIEIPEKTFYIYKGDPDYEKWNPKMVLKYEIGEGAILVPEVNPDPAKTVESFSEVKLTFKNNVAYTENEGLTVKYNGEAQARTVTAEGAVATIALATPIATDGTVTIHIPASCFMTEDEYSNKELDYTFTIKTAASEKKEEAKAFYDKYTDVVGYPTSESDAAKALQAIIAKEVVTVAEIEAAMKAYYTETSVRVPGNDEYFKIVSVNSKNPGDSLYVAYEEGSIILTTDKSKSAVFISSKNSDKVVLKTTDGKYLHVFTSKNESLTSTTGVTDAKSEANDLTIAKLVVDGKEEETFGKLSVKGLIGKTDLGNKETYAVANFEKATFIDDIASNIYFEEKLSSALVFQKTEKPEIFVNLTPTISSVLDNSAYTMYITFSSSENVTLAATPAKVTITKRNGTKVMDVEIKADGNRFVAELGTIAAGSYTLIIPEKTFISTVNGDARYNTDMKIDFELRDLADPSVGFTQNLTGIVYLWNNFFQTIDYPCESLNDYIIFIEHNHQYTEEKFKDLFNHVEKNVETVWDESSNSYVEKVMGETYSYVPGDLVPANKVVALTNYYTHEVIRTGHLVRCEELNSDSIRALKVVFDDGLIEPKDLPKGAYKFEFEAASYGDANFGKYLNDPASVDPAKCNVNPALGRTIYIDNDWFEPATPELEMLTDETGNTLMITFDAVNNVKPVSNVIDVTVKSVNTGEVFPEKLRPTGEDYEFMVELKDLAVGQYKMTVPESSLKSISKYGGVRYNKEFSISFAITTTGINSIITDNGDAAVMFDVYGRRIDNASQPGIYIINGKKVIKK